jgi:hypothetical protein
MSDMADVIDIRRARLMRAIGRPANTPVEVLPATAMKAMSEGYEAGTAWPRKLGRVTRLKRLYGDLPTERTKDITSSEMATRKSHYMS